MNVFVTGGHEAFEKRMRFGRFTLEFRVELAGDVKGMVTQLNDFYELAVGRKAAEHETRRLEHLAVGIVEFVAMAMAFVHQERAVEVRRARAHDQLAGLRAKTHGAALLRDLLLFVQQTNDRVW